MWNQVSQWEPSLLCSDVVRVAERLLSRPREKPIHTFFSSIVLQQVRNPVDLMQVRTHYRRAATTYDDSPTLDALHAEPVRQSRQAPHRKRAAVLFEGRRQIQGLADHRDRPAFNGVMGATPPLDFDAIGQRAHGCSPIASGCWRDYVDSTAFDLEEEDDDEDEDDT